MIQTFSFLLLTLLIAPWSSDAQELIDPKAAQRALIQYMTANSDCFAGFTKHLLSDAEQLILSEDGNTAYIGRIKVDRIKATYSYEHWSEDEEVGRAMNLSWNGQIKKTSDGKLEVEAPSLTQEKFLRAK